MTEILFSRFREFRIPEEPVTAAWRSASNIAFIKYWGKKPGQFPVNPSLSLSLSASYTETSVRLSPERVSTGPEVEFYFEGLPNEAFGERIQKYLTEISTLLPFLAHARLRIDSGNTFPHSSGIASSASAFSALALCITELAEKTSGIKVPDFPETASFLARIGSGSASRSLYGGITLWGNTPYLQDSSDDLAIPVPGIYPLYEGLRDAILLVSKDKKKVSSSAGHGRMEQHPFAAARVEQANRNTGEMIHALREGDVESFIRITEQEALTLHALMMTSDPGFILMEPESLQIINRIRAAREATGLNICFTLDAGPNVHLLYFEKDHEQVHNLIVEDLLKNNKQTNWINDKMGTGPERVEQGS